MFMGFASYGTDAVVSTLLFPLLIKFLGKTDAGAWMLFSSLGGLFGCLLNGTGPVVARATARAAADQRAEAGALSAVRVSAGRLYRKLLLVVVLAALLLAAIYMPRVASENNLAPAVLVLAWLIFVFGWSLRALAGKHFSFLDGIGEIGYSRAFTTVAGGGNILVLFLLLPLGGGLLVPATVYAAASGALWWAAIRLGRRKLPEAFRYAPSFEKNDTFLKESMQMAVLTLTSFVTSQSCIIMVERTEGTGVLATFAPVIRVVVLMAGAASLPATLLFPYLSRAHRAGSHAQLRRYVVATILAPPLLFAGPGMLLLLFPKEIIEFWLGAGNFIGVATVRWTVAYGLLFTLHSAIAMPAIAAGAQTFVRESILNMALVLIAMPLCVRMWGLPGYPLGMLLGTIPLSLIVIVKSAGFIRGISVNAVIPQDGVRP